MLLKTNPQVSRIANRFIKEFLEANVVLLIVLARQPPNSYAGCDGVYDLTPIRELSSGLPLKPFVSTNYLLQGSKDKAIEKKPHNLVSDRPQ
jgi:hypothetical protein